MAVVMPLILSLLSSDGGSDWERVMLRLNVSSSSIRLSIGIGILIVAVVVSAMKVGMILSAT